jgi:D-aminoacyl-tRNA deacylase
MSDGIAIVCSKSDKASLNIACNLLDLVTWEDRDGYRSFGQFCLIIHDQQQTGLKDIESKLEDIGLKPKMIVFPCRHKAKEEVPWLGGHFTGETAPLNGGEKRLSMASPIGLCSFLHNITKEAPEKFRISAEATHHGPTDLSIPSFFAEIGSSENQWSDPIAGKAVAKSILDLDMSNLPVFLGVGGGHYVPRQTSLMIEAKIAFGHMFSSYQFETLDTSILEEAKEKSGATYAYLDRKSFRSENRNKALKMFEEIGLPVLKSKEIRERFPA